MHWNAFNLARVPPITFGPGTISRLQSLIESFGSRVLFVTGGSPERTPAYLGKVWEKLDRGAMEWNQVHVSGEPGTAFVDLTCRHLRYRDFEVVVGIGGGSVIDAAKAISAMLPHENSILDHLEGVGRGIPHDGRKIPFIAIPTTSGTGGEVTKNAVLSEVGPEGYKKSIRHDNLIPDRVLIDPELMVTCPPEVTAACGMDAFTQLLEPLVSTASNPLTDTLALSGLSFIQKNLEAACGQGASDPDIRAGMAYGSLQSGICLANAGLGIVHGLASPLGGRFPIPHGVVCGTLLASATRVNIRALRRNGSGHAALNKYAQAGALFGEAGSSDPSYLCDHLVHRLEHWVEHFRLPRLSHYGVKATDLDAILAQTQNRHNPVQLNPAEIREILESRL